MNGAVTDLNSLWRPYQYRGNVFDAAQPWPEKKQRRTMSPEQVCGTMSGYWRHGRRGEEPCERCLEASCAYRKELRKRKGKPPVAPAPAAPCGTLGGYSKHLRDQDEPCKPCRDAKNARRKELAAMRRAAA